MEIIFNNVENLAAFIGSLTVIGGALMWLYNRLIVKPREKRKAKHENERQVAIMELISSRNEPLLTAINDLNELTQQGLIDRENLHKIADVNTNQLGNHEERLDNHNERIIILETKNGIHRPEK